MKQSNACSDFSMYLQAGRGREGTLLSAAGGGDRRRHRLNKEGESGRGDRKRKNASLCKGLLAHLLFLSAICVYFCSGSNPSPPAQHPSAALPPPSPLPKFYQRKKSRKGTSGTVVPVVPSLHSSIIFLAFVLYLFGGSHDIIIDIFIW